MRIQLALCAFVTLIAAPGMVQGQCVPTLNPTGGQASSDGGTGSISVALSPSTCARNASSNASWLTVTFGQTGTGNGSVGYRVDANPTYAARTGAISVAGATFTLTQAGLPCPAASISPGGQGVQPAGGTFSINVTSPCGWTASSDSGWITLNNSSGSTSGSLSYTVAANNSGAARSGNITVNTVTFSVSQTSVDCTFTISPLSVNVGPAGATNQITVQTSNSGCLWAVQNTASWITNLTVGGKPGTTASGNGTVGYTVSANTSRDSRSTALVIASQVIAITQAGNVCALTPNPAAVNVTSAATTGTFAVTTSTSTCPWTAASNSKWIAVTSGAKGATSGTVAYAIDSNTSIQPRNGSITLAADGSSSAFNVNQDACTSSPTFAPLNQAVTSSGGNFSVAVNTSCTWTATTSAQWIALNAGSGTTGNGSLSYTVAPNNAASSRSGSIVINGVAFAVTQAGISSSGAGISFTAQSVVSGASFQFGALAPGELISIFGSGLGPAQPVGLQLTADGRSVTTVLGGTRVLFDGKPSPLTYVSAIQVNAIVPFGLAGAARTQVAVEVQGIASTEVTAGMSAAVPAMFAVAGGKGQGAILNQDSSPNSALNPAARGTVLQIFATGLGQTNPAGVDGQIAGATVSSPVQKVTATVGGIDAAVQYVGSSTGLVAGVTQINVAIPAGVQAGDAVPVVLTVGGFGSAPGVTVAIR